MPKAKEKGTLKAQLISRSLPQQHVDFRVQCDQAKPACGRCTRLSLECVGGGVQRYIFKGPKRVEWRDVTIREAQPSARKSASRSITPAVERPVCGLSATLVSFISVINPADDAQYSLCWAYGPYMLEIPRRLGHSRALDTAAEALVESHATACRRQPPSLKCLQDYSRALAALRQSLENPDMARSAETLCAIMLLLMCQVSWHQDTDATNNADQADVHRRSRIPIRLLYRSLRGCGAAPSSEGSCPKRRSIRASSPVIALVHGSKSLSPRPSSSQIDRRQLCEAVFNDRIILVPDDWTRLVVEPLGRDNPSVTMISFVWEMQELIRRWKQVSACDVPDTSLISQARHRYHEVLSAVSLWRERTEGLRASYSCGGRKRNAVVQLEAVLHRVYGFHVAIALLTAAVVSTIDRNNGRTSLYERQLLARQAVEAATQCAVYGPLAANLSPLVLGAAFIAAPTNLVQTQVRAVYVRFVSTRSGASAMRTKRLIQGTQYETSVPPVDRDTAIAELEYSSAMFWRNLA